MPIQCYSLKLFTKNFWIYLTAALFWSLGLMAFFLTYNLYLLELGFREKFMGQVSASMTLGSLCASLPAGVLLNRIGLNRVVQLAVLTTAISLLCRSYLETPGLLLVFAFINGASVGAWMVATPPFLTQNTSPHCRSRAFSWCYGGSIGMGALAGILVGRLPRWTSTLSREIEGLAEKRLILLTSTLLASLAFVLLLWLKEENGHSMLLGASMSKANGATKQSQSRRFVLRMVWVIALWSLFSGSFPPFFNVFFYRKFHQGLAGLGLIFSLSQLCQLLAILSMPWFVRKLGRIPAIFMMQVAASFFLPLLVLTDQIQVAGLVYLTYLSFQVMSEPALENFIMDSVRSEERNRVSSIRYTTLFLVQALAVWAAGISIEKIGYAFSLLAIAGLGMAAALNFYLCFHSLPALQTSKEAPQEVH